jgi:hypothetical protein
VVATDNRGPEHLPEPLQDRFMALLRVTEPHPDALAKLSPDLRELAEASLSIPSDRRITGRDWAHLQMLEAEFGRRDACLLVFGPERGEMIFEAIQLALAAKRRKV